MFMSSWSAWSTSRRCGTRNRFPRLPRLRPRRPRLGVEFLEDRTLPSFLTPVNYAVTDPVALAVADVNNDGKSDLIVANASTNSVSVLLGNGNGTFHAAKTFAVGTDPQSVAVADFNGDGKSDIVTANDGLGNFSLLLGNGDGTFQSALDFALPQVKDSSGQLVSQQALSLAIGDFNNDGKPDVAVTGVALWYDNGPPYAINYYANVFLNNGKDGFRSPTTTLINSQPAYSLFVYPFDDAGSTIALGDFNNDGRLDIAATAGSPSNGRSDVYLLSGSGNGNLKAGTWVDDVAGSASLAAGDLDGDGKLDLAVAGSGENDVHVLLDNGNGTFQSPVTYPVGSTPIALVAADFNSDGKLDLTTANEAGDSVSVLFGHGNGTFLPRANFAAGSGPAAMAVGDFNRDGFPDLAVVEAGSNNAAVLLNAQNWSALNSVVMALPSTTTAGVAQNFTVRAVNSFGLTVTNYMGTVQFTSTDPQALLPLAYTFSAGDMGAHAFTATLKTAGTQTIAVTDNSGLTSSGTVTVNPAAASTFAIALPSYNQFSYPLISGRPWTITVTPEDAYGNYVSSYAGTIHFSSSDPLAVLPAGSPLSGTASFQAILATVGTQTITVTDTAHANITGTQSFAVAPWVNMSSQTISVPINQPAVFILTAGGGGLTPNTAFTFDLGGGQTVSGPSGATVTYTFTGFAPATVEFDSVTVAANGITSPQVQFAFPLLPFNIEPDPGNPSQSALVLSGTFTKETLNISPGTNNAVHAAFLSGSSLVGGGDISTPSGVAFAHLIVNGSGDINVLHLTGGLAVPALIFTDGILDASGSIANNILVGQGGNDTLTGGSGRDILIAGLGASALHAGSGGDILIGGYTTYDNNIAALLAIMTEWGRSDADYNTRIGHLLGTISGGLNGSYFLNSSTVFDNGLVDVLTGGAGMDWFFAHPSKKNGDIIQNLGSGEEVATI
jgi:hypothetical protein